MNSAAGVQSVLTADYVNPVISATRTCFQTMLGCTPRRIGLMFKDGSVQKHEISAVIGISGQAAGTIVLSLSKSAALQVYERMLENVESEITPDVRDAVGELTNMIAGQAKAQLAQFELSVSIPNVVSGENHVVHFPSNVRPILIPFESEIGPFAIEVGFANLTQPK
jgi:chemotaxis protein CheX